MKDKLNRPVSIGDTVMYTSYGTDWQFGMVAKVKANSIRIFEGWTNYDWTGKLIRKQCHIQNKTSNNHLLVLVDDQIREAHTLYPFISGEQTFEEFMEVFEEYCKAL